MNELKYIELGKIAKIEASGVDKKIKDSEEFVKLCNFVDIYRNWAITKKMNDSFMDGSANQNEIAKFALKKGQVAITKDSETRDDIGMSAYIADDFDKTVLGYHCTLITPDPLVLNGKYLNAYLNSPTARKYFSNQASGSGQRYTLTSEAVGKVKVPLIKLTEQIVIGELFSTIDKKIQLNKRINDNLELQMKTLYDYWFTQFDFPNNNGNSYRASGGKLVWNDILKKEIPQNWQTIPMSDIFIFESGYPFSSDIYKSCGKYKLLTIKNVQSDGINTNVDNYIEELPANLPEYCLLKPNDILMSLTGNVGRIGIMYSDDCLLNQRVAVAKPINNDLNSFVYHLLKSELVHKQYEAIANGSSQQNLSPIDAGAVMIPFNETVAIQFSSICKNNLSTIVANLAENQVLANIRDWLLPLLMNGQISIE